MDGLMFDTEPLWSESWAPALALFGLPFKEGLDQSARGSAGENLRAVIRSYYGPDCPAEEIIAAFDKIAHEKFLSPVPKKPGLDNLLDWLEARGIPMAVVSSSGEAVIRRNLDNWQMTSRFKAIGVAPASCLVLEDSHNGVRAGAAGGFVTVMVPDLMPDTPEMQGLYTMKCDNLNQVLDKLKAGEL